MSKHPSTPTAAEPPPAHRAPTLRQLRSFQAVARAMSFRQAAEALSLTQPALSASIRELETVLGTPVLERSTHHVRLTPQGALLEERMGAVGVRVEYFPYTAHTSSTQLRRVIEAAS